MERELICCPICRDLLKVPVTIPCGHSFCMSCITMDWDNKKGKRISCPQCRKTFRQRSDLIKNIMLADLVIELKNSILHTSDDHCYAGAKDVACDCCTGRKLKAVKSCLVCLVSYCEKHLQPHYESPAFEKHKLVDPSKKLLENICSRQNEVIEMFSQSDQQSICHICVLDQYNSLYVKEAEVKRPVTMFQKFFCWMKKKRPSGVKLQIRSL